MKNKTWPLPTFASYRKNYPQLSTRLHNSDGYRMATRNLEYFQMPQDLYSNQSYVQYNSLATELLNLACPELGKNVAGVLHAFSSVLIYYHILT
jgi:hypothetical protein